MHKILQEMIDKVTDLSNSINDTFESIIKNSIRKPEDIFDEQDCVNIHWNYQKTSIYLELRIDSWTLKSMMSEKILGFSEFKGKDLNQTFRKIIRR